jgi:hypothetical protein
MSLINDALKKASQTPTPTTPAPTKEPLHVATHTPAPRWPFFVVPPLVAIVFATGTFMVMRGWQGSRGVSAKETAPQIQATPESVALKVPVPAAVPKAEPAPTNAVAAAPAPVFPTLKLQGVIWNPRRPSAVINGKSLFIGEKVERAVLTAIEQDSVKVTWNGEERVLTLP